MTLRLLLNGKTAGEEPLRQAVTTMREQGYSLDVRVSWEGGDVARFIQEAAEEGVTRIIVGGGDGTLNEAVNGLMQVSSDKRPELGIIPMGTANDFATAATLPTEPLEALTLALKGHPRSVDVGKLDELFFLNMLSGGFGAKITTSTPPLLKKMLGGGAYSLVGAMRFWSFEPYRGELRWDGGSCTVDAMVLAIGNGRQAGGSQELTPHAQIDDGLLDVLIVDTFGYRNIPAVVKEMEALGPDGRFVRYFKTAWVTFESEQKFPLNLDGEAHEVTTLECSVKAGAVNIVLPDDCRLCSQ
ncbi:lipid kinase YegS [Larsenimonas salina]|uniref:lipid kinase YegS n=1 Tax=Larsenimonas salina TaxID=1295565 RepID=UPI002074042D|nr:lipid kinase YegS [Larsenimonas salina]MCM5703579.1 lipid kinase YegS [Larsenimonas salina]